MEQENTQVVETNQEQEQVNSEPKMYTEEEVKLMIQSESDKRVTNALKKQEQKMKEATKLASMSEEDKASYEYNQKFQALEEREKAIAKKEMLTETQRQLSDKGLPIEAAQFIVTEDAETTSENIKIFNDIFNKAIDLEITKRIATGSPSAAYVDNGAITIDQFRKMSLAQQSELFQKQPDLYNALSRGI